MSKERARRREVRAREQEMMRQQRQRRYARQQQRLRLRRATKAPLRAVAQMASRAWRPLSGGQMGVLARRRRRRFLVMLMLAVLVNTAVWLVTLDGAFVGATVGMTLLTMPVLARLLFARR